MVICWWATGCCGGSPTVSADLQSPYIFFFFFSFLFDFLVRGFVGLIAFRKMLSWWVCGFAVMVGL